MHGLAVRSDLKLPAQRCVAEPDVLISLGERRGVPREPPAGRLIGELVRSDLAFWASEHSGDGSRTLRYAHVCDATVDRSQTDVVVYPHADAELGLVEVVVSGGVLAHVLAFRRELALHASAVEKGNGAIVLCGPSGGGKSTLAAALCAAGARLVTDDCLRIEVHADGALCFPGSNGIRLRSGAADWAGRIEGARLEATVDGRFVLTPVVTAESSLDVRAVVLPVLTATEGVQIERLDALTAAQELLGHPRLIAWREPEMIAQLFQGITRLADGTPVYRARLPTDPGLRIAAAEELLNRFG